MRRAILTFGLLGCGLPALPAEAIEPPASVVNARIDTRADVTPAAALEQARRSAGTTWVGWSVPAISKATDVCCLGDNFRRRGCSLAEREHSWGTTDRPGPAFGHELYVFVEATARSNGRVVVASSDCPIDGADRRVAWLGRVDAGASLSALTALLDDGRDEDHAVEPALAAIAYHEDVRADAVIEKRVLDTSLSASTRQKAIFWAGQARGEAGFRLLSRVLSSESDPDLRQHAVFALSQSSVAEAPARIKRVAVDDRSADVRAHALFCLSQTKDKDAGAWIVGRLDAEKNEHVREQAVFALSQLTDGTDWLLKVLRSKRDPETVRHALFWLGQSKDPRALEELEKILE